MKTTAVEHLVRSLYRLGLVQRSIARHALLELGSQGFVALGLIRRHEPVRISEVAQLLSVDLSVASRQVAALCAAGYADRQPDPDDRRAHRVTATAKGELVLRDAHAGMVEAFAGALGSWSEEDVTTLAELLDRLREDFARTPVATDPPQEALS